MIHWLLQTAAQCPELAAGEAPAGLLSAAELQRLEQLTTVKRRREWLLGRCAAKRLVQRYVEVETGQRPPLDALVIARESEDNAAPVAVFDSLATPMDLPAGVRWVSRAPLVAEPGRRRGYPVPRVSGMLLPISLSISHSSEMAFCALYAIGGRWRAATSAGEWQDQAISTGFPAGGLVQVGVDVEGIEPRTDSFVQAYFAAEEIHWIGQALDGEQALLATATWSAKEAVLKALRLGLTVDTRRVRCLPATGMELTAGPEHGWNEVHVDCDLGLLPMAAGQARGSAAVCDWDIRGWWRREGKFVLTMALLWREAMPQLL